MLQRSGAGFQLGEQVKIQPRGKNQGFLSPSTPPVSTDTHSAQYIPCWCALHIHTVQEPAAGPAPTSPAATSRPQQQLGQVLQWL